MATDLNQLLSLGQTQQAVQGRYSDYLRSKRDVSQLRQTTADVAGAADERFRGAFGPQGESGAVVNPEDIFSSYNTFNAAIPSQADLFNMEQSQAATESDFLSQIAGLAKERQAGAGIGVDGIEAPSYSDQLAAAKDNREWVKGEDGSYTLKSIGSAERGIGQLLAGKDQATTGLTTDERELLKGEIEFQRSIGGDTRQLEQQLGIVRDTQVETQRLIAERKSLVADGMELDKNTRELAQLGYKPDMRDKLELIKTLDEILANPEPLAAITGSKTYKGLPLISSKSAFSSKAISSIQGRIDQIVDSLTIEARSKLAGQGTITDREQETLERAESRLKNTGIDTLEYISYLKELRDGLSADVSAVSNIVSDQPAAVTTSTGNQFIIEQESN